MEGEEEGEGVVNLRTGGEEVVEEEEENWMHAEVLDFSMGENDKCII